MPVIGRFAGVDPISEQFAHVSVYNYAENSPIANIDLWGLQAVSINDKDGNERFSGDYNDSSSPDDVKDAVDAVSTIDNSCIDEICFSDVGPQEFSQKTWWGAKRAILHEMSYSYTGTGEDGTPTEGTGSLLVPVTTYKTGSSLGDVVLGGLLSKGFQLIGSSFVKGTTQGASTATARGLGAVGEKVVGNIGSKTRIPSLTGTAKYRIPDGLTSTTLTEVKNVAHQSLTSQLRDFHMFSQQTGRKFILYTRSTTTFSRPLQSLINQGEIILKRRCCMNIAIKNQLITKINIMNLMKFTSNFEIRQYLVLFPIN